MADSAPLTNHIHQLNLSTAFVPSSLTINQPGLFATVGLCGNNAIPVNLTVTMCKRIQTLD